MTRTHAHAHTQWRKSVRLVLMRFQPLIIKSHTERERERERRAELQDYPLSFQPSIFVTRTLICLPSHFFFPVTLFFFSPVTLTHTQSTISVPSFLCVLHCDKRGRLRMHRCVSSPQSCGMQSRGINVPFVGVNHAAADRLELIAKPVFEGERAQTCVLHFSPVRCSRLLHFRADLPLSLPA